MCGIAGVLEFEGRQASASRIHSMIETLVHRGPDGAGVHIAGSAGLGHRRLAIIDLSDAGRQPMSNEDGTVWLTFNGEIYNFKALRAELEQRGHRFRSHCDAEVIIHAYEEWGTACLTRMNGMFAFGLWDARSDRLWLVRDRLGVKPLFYCHLPGALLFASEVKAILADPRVPRTLDLEALQYYLAFNYVPAPFTLMRNIRQVEPGHHVMVSASGAVVDDVYWDLVYHEGGDRRSDREYVEEFNALMDDSVRLRLVSDVPFGVFLSGGVDSSGVAYWMSRNLGSPVKTFSMGFGEESYDELRYARLTAARIGSDHHEEIVTADAATLLPTIVRHAEEPTADSSMVAVYYLSKLARQSVTMVLTGDGADDYLAGYETYQAYYLARLYRMLPSLLRRGIVGPLIHALPVSDSKVSLESKLKRFVVAAELPPDDAHATWRIICDEPSRARLLTPLGGVGLIDPIDIYRRAFARTNARRPLNRLLYVDTMLYLPSDMLVKVDRMTMAHGLEAREPYLDYRLLEFAARVPPRLKLRHFREKKYLLKESLRGKVPDEILSRKKQGFNVPKARWIKHGLKPFVRDHLSALRVRETGVLDPAAVQTLLDDHFKGVADNSHQIWGLLVLVLWFEQFVNVPAAA